MSQLNNAIQNVEELGYCHLPGLFTAEEVQEALARVKNEYERTKDLCSDKVPYLNIGQPTVYNLQNKDPFFLKLLFKNKILEDILIHFLNDRWFKQIPQDQPNYVIRSYIARSTNAATPMHIDSFIPYISPHVFLMQFSIVLEDQAAENGATVVVPKSHLSCEYTTQEAAKEAIPVESKAGDVVLWDSRLWHGTTENRTDGTRWSIIATYCRWWLKQHWNVPQSLPQATYEGLTDSQKAVLGFCSISHRDETAGIDLKCGYEDLKPEVRNYWEPAPN